MEKRYYKKFKNPYRWEGKQFILYAKKDPLLFLSNVKVDVIEYLSTCSAADQGDLEEMLRNIHEAESAYEAGNMTLVAWKTFEIGYFVGVHDYSKFIYKAARNTAGSKKGGAENRNTQVGQGIHTQDEVLKEYDLLIKATPPTSDRDIPSKIAKKLNITATHIRRILKRRKMVLKEYDLLIKATPPTSDRDIPSKIAKKLNITPKYIENILQKIKRT